MSSRSRMALAGILGPGAVALFIEALLGAAATFVLVALAIAIVALALLAAWLAEGVPAVRVAREMPPGLSSY